MGTIFEGMMLLILRNRDGGKRGSLHDLLKITSAIALTEAVECSFDYVSLKKDEVSEPRQIGVCFNMADYQTNLLGFESVDIVDYD
jgi:hypothetical protein